MKTNEIKIELTGKILTHWSKELQKTNGRTYRLASVSTVVKEKKITLTVMATGRDLSNLPRIGETVPLHGRRVKDPILGNKWFFELGFNLHEQTEDEMLDDLFLT